ncbi:hypothetical protein V6N13_091385 [Hibiscus sabdariffa]|uniref:Eukaryotic translation initiation factor 3 30 kDa subunit n=1 Tax=Hibiscus sabdariffa TaxID=183260 RepID=A0ABR2QDN9_9ROSI
MLVEEVDYKSTTELFAKKGDDKTLDNFIPKSESDFLEFAELISHKLHPHEKSYHYIALLRAVIRLSVTSLKAAERKTDISTGSNFLLIENCKSIVVARKSSSMLINQMMIWLLMLMMIWTGMTFCDSFGAYTIMFYCLHRDAYCSSIVDDPTALFEGF